MIDTHAHLISDDLEKYRPQPLSGTLRAGDLDDPMTAERLLREMDRHKVERALLVQRAHVYGYDNSYVADMAARYPDRFRAVAVIDALGPDAGKTADHWIGERGVAGIRLTEPFKGAGTDWFASAETERVWASIAGHRAFLCLQLYRWNRIDCIAALPGLLKRYPDVRVMIDHMTSLVEDGPPDFGFDAALMSLQQNPNVYLKFTTINFSRAMAKGIDTAELLAKAVECYGASRLMWGSDVAQSPQSYAEMTGMARSATRAFEEPIRRSLLSGTAGSFFGGE